MSGEERPAKQLEDREAIECVKPQELVAVRSLSQAEVDAIQKAPNALYAFWLNGNKPLLAEALAAEFVDRTLPPERPQGPEGPAAAAQIFREAIPDTRIKVILRIVTEDRVISHLRFTGHFTGTFQSVQGSGQPIDFISIEILQVVEGKIVEIRHQEDNLTFMQQVGRVK